MKMFLLVLLTSFFAFAATETGVVTRLGANKKAVQVVWSSLNGASSDVGDSFEIGAWVDASVQCEGTFSSTVITMQSSNDGTNWQGTLDTAGATTFSAAGLKTLITKARYIRPSSASGTGTVVCTLFASQN